MAWLLFLDDERFPPDDGREWIIARSSAEALALVDVRGWPESVSLDHDLGGEDTAMVFLHGAIDRLVDASGAPLPFTWTVHSQNPIGRDNLLGLLASYERLCAGAAATTSALTRPTHPDPAAPTECTGGRRCRTPSS